MTPILYSLLVSFLLSMIMGYPAKLLAERWNLMDIPGSASHKVHARPTPLAGGLLSGAVLFIMAIIFRDRLNRELLVVFAGTLIIIFFGLWDDRKSLFAGPKLVGQLLAALILILSGVQVHFMEVLFQAGYVSASVAAALNFVITIFWLVGITNAVNLIDSMDGIVAGFGFITSAFFLGATELSDQSLVSFWSAALLGLCAGLYYWNGIAAKFFLGDSGAQAIGFLLASFGILYNPLDRSPESSWIVPIMLLGIPIFDTTLVVISRLKRGQPVSTGRRDHTYHRFIAMGIRPRYAVSIVHGMTLIISTLAFISLYFPPLTALILFSISILLGLSLMIWLEPKATLDDHSEGTSRE